MRLLLKGNLKMKHFKYWARPDAYSPNAMPERVEIIKETSKQIKYNNGIWTYTSRNPEQFFDTKDGAYDKLLSYVDQEIRKTQDRMKFLEKTRAKILKNKKRGKISDH